jgi:hypothetical protein
VVDSLVCPRRSDIDADSVRFDYDHVSDTLMVHLHGDPRPAYSLDIDDFKYLCIDLETNTVVGIQVEAFLSKAINADPRYLLWAMAAGLPRDEIVRALERERPSDLRQSAIALVLSAVERAIT